MSLPPSRAASRAARAANVRPDPRSTSTEERAMMIRRRPPRKTRVMWVRPPVPRCPPRPRRYHAMSYGEVRKKKKTHRHVMLRSWLVGYGVLGRGINEASERRRSAVDGFSLSFLRVCPPCLTSDRRQRNFDGVMYPPPISTLLLLFSSTSWGEGGKVSMEMRSRWSACLCQKPRDRGRSDRLPTG